MDVRVKTVVAIAAAVALGAGCAVPQPYTVGGAPYPVYGDPPVAVQRTEYGVVESIDMVRDGGTTSGLGAVLGGIAGGVIGHQFGSGRGNTAATG
jgi:outer membrane lipoprotein SlyB